MHPITIELGNRRMFRDRLPFGNLLFFFPLQAFPGSSSSFLFCTFYLVTCQTKVGRKGSDRKHPNHI